jgi:hypothetical protein
MQALAQTLRNLADTLEAGPPDVRRTTQAQRVEVRRGNWVNLGAPNGYVSKCGHGRVTWNGRRWIAFIDGEKVGRTYGYKTSFKARRACGSIMYRRAA